MIPNIPVKIRPGQYDDHGLIRLRMMKAADRVGASPGMERDQKIARFSAVFLQNFHAVAEFFQNRGPALRSDSIAVVEV